MLIKISILSSSLEPSGTSFSGILGIVVRCVRISFLTESNFSEISLDFDFSVDDFILSSSTFLSDLLDLKISAISFDIVFDSKRI